MPKSKERWVEITVLTPAKLVDALSNFLEEMGADGVFQEVEIGESFTGIKPSTQEEIKVYLPWSHNIKKQTACIEAYINGLTSLFPGVIKPQLSQKIIIDPDSQKTWRRHSATVKLCCMKQEETMNGSAIHSGG